MQMVLPEGVTLTGAGRHWPRAAPEQEVARWPPAASGSSRAGPTLENDSQSALIGRRGFFLSEILRESHNDSHKCGCKPDLVATILIRSDTCDTDQGSSGTILNPAKQPQSRQPAIPRENGGISGSRCQKVRRRGDLRRIQDGQSPPDSFVAKALLIEILQQFFNVGDYSKTSEICDSELRS
jgi:hypothetical protein